MARELDFVDECYADKDLSLLKKLTLVIPTFNRNYLKRCLWYHAHFPFGQIIVADSSFDEKKIENREIIAKIREEFGANILHLEYQPETEKYGGDIYRKWGDAVQHVETEYSQICTDKEFYIPTALCQHISYLNENTDYIAALGSYGQIFESSKKKNLILEINDWFGFKGDSSNNVERILDSFNNPCLSLKSLLNATYSSAHHKLIYNYYLNNKHVDIRYGELFLSFSGNICGKVKYFKTLYRTRDNTNIRRDIAMTKSSFCNSKESSTSRYPTVSEYGYDRKLYYQTFIQAINEMLNDDVNISDSEAKYIIQKLPETSVLLAAHSKYNIKEKLSSIYNIYHAPQKIWASLPLLVQHNISQLINKTIAIPFPEIKTQKSTLGNSPETMSIKLAIARFSDY